MPKKSVIQKIAESFGPEGKDIKLSEEEKKYKLRLQKVLDIKLDDILITDYDLHKRLKKEYPYQNFPQTCRDISIVERIIANEKNPVGDPQKVWMRYFLSEILKKALKIAQANGDAYTVAYTANILGKHHLTDKEDLIVPNYEDIVPLQPEITNDPSHLGIKRIDNLEQVVEKLKEKYNVNLDFNIELPSHIEDAEYEEN